MPTPDERTYTQAPPHRGRREAPLWTVTDQKLGVAFDNSQQPRETWTISFRTRSGADGYIRVEPADYTAEHVAALIHAAAEQIEKVHALAGPIG